MRDNSGQSPTDSNRPSEPDDPSGTTPHEETPSPSSGPSSKDESLEDFSRRLAKARGDDKKPERGNEAQPGLLGKAMRLSVEMVLGLVVGGGIGWFLDGLLGTAPWLMIVFLFLGIGAGLLNVMRAAREMNAPNE